MGCDTAGEESGCLQSCSFTLSKAGDEDSFQTCETKNVKGERCFPSVSSKNNTCVGVCHNFLDEFCFWTSSDLASRRPTLSTNLSHGKAAESALFLSAYREKHNSGSSEASSWHLFRLSLHLSPFRPSKHLVGEDGNPSVNERRICRCRGFHRWQASFNRIRSRVPLRRSGSS